MWKFVIPLSLFASSAAADATAGEQVFLACAACHHERADATGPLLDDVLGRPAGKVPGFRYSSAMKRASFAWAEDRLRAFLRDPQSVVRGNKMTFSGLSEATQIEDVIAYLRKRKTP
jgi:cytochrome c